MAPIATTTVSPAAARHPVVRPVPLSVLDSLLARFRVIALAPPSGGLENEESAAALTAFAQAHRPSEEIRRRE
ncbi:hypothetical protein WS70_18495 [Burkholderia mayonis]|uniref:Uncharacterized protein n=1 Tax=Burkholderia mayonis TaxID=1385591 RepID=A0A1B4FJQ2_9BURK|nr:hypothetical protein WS70_18495 [Burkholderia mayonis]KVE40534.1 hypothetical protein WS70_17175 [Burkholderia mayonis]